jgi:hypothetical protein
VKTTNRKNEKGAMGYMLLWLLGIPIPILLIIFSHARLHIAARWVSFYSRGLHRSREIRNPNVRLQKIETNRHAERVVPVMIHRFDKLATELPEPAAPNANAAAAVQELVVEDEIAEGAPWPDFEEEPQLVSPGSVDPEMIQWYAEALTT